MFVLTTLLFIILLFIVLISIAPLKVVFTMNSEEFTGYRMMFSWLNPLIKGTIVKAQEGNVLKIYLFGKKFFTKKVAVVDLDLNEKLMLVRKLEPHFTRFEASYSFTDPSYTGMVCGVINMLPQYIDLDNLYNRPDFSSYSEYFNVNAVVEMNLRSLISSFMNLNRKATKIQAQH